VTPNASSPGIADYASAESAAGPRPRSSDNLPLIGGAGPPALLGAPRHDRNGMLLIPVTADAVLELLPGRPLPDVMRAADPA
jgi:glycine oxidase